MYTPKFIEWDDTFSTGDDSLDEHHRYLIITFNHLGEAINGGYGVDMAHRILGRLKFYAGWHFEQEEECFDHYQCPAAASNKKAHNEFIEKFDNFYNEFQRNGGTEDLVCEIHKELSSWIMNHILMVDGELYPCIHRRAKPANK